MWVLTQRAEGLGFLRGCSSEVGPLCRGWVAVALLVIKPGIPKLALFIACSVTSLQLPALSVLLSPLVTLGAFPPQLKVTKLLKNSDALGPPNKKTIK